MERVRNSASGIGSGRHRRRAALQVLGVVTVVVATATACTPAGPDTTPPELSAPDVAAFVVGSQVTRGSEYEPGVSEFTSGIRARVTWSATDAGSGVCRHEVRRVYAGLEPETVFESTSETGYVDTETDYDDQFGGGSLKVQGWEVTAEDCAGNASTVEVAGGPAVMQEDGTTVGYDVAPLDFDGAWSSGSCACWSNGAVQRTTQAGASATFTNGDRTTRVALVMRQGPDRGRFAVEVDGEEVAVVDNLRTTPRDRVVVWESAVDAGAEVRVVNEGTEGRPRIDVDAVLVRPA